MTSKQTEPAASSIFGWKILFTKPIDGDLYGYASGSSTCTFHTPPWYGPEDHHGRMSQSSKI